MNAKQIMQQGVAVVSPELTIRQFQQFLIAEEISGAPVVGSDGALLGVASKTDIVGALAERDDDRADELGAGITVQDLMSQNVVSVGPDTSLDEVAEIMLSGHLHRLVVVDGESIVGIITPFDLLRALLGR